MNREERPMTDELTALLGELAAVLDDLVLAIREVKASVCEAVQELRHRAARRLYELADRLMATEER
jgi:tRNA U34 5-carboxymethylaminomethyl modifying enzyme MnmG/GidA